MTEVWSHTLLAVLGASNAYCLLGSLAASAALHGLDEVFCSAVLWQFSQYMAAQGEGSSINRTFTRTLLTMV